MNSFFMDWLRDLVTDQELMKSLAYIVVCFGGQLCLAFWLWLGDEVECTWDRFRTVPKATMKALLTNIALIVAIVAALEFDTVSWKMVLWMAFLQGVSVDSALNKNARVVWTGVQRQSAP